MQNEAILL